MDGYVEQVAESFLDESIEYRSVIVDSDQSNGEGVHARGLSVNQQNLSTKDRAKIMMKKRTIARASSRSTIYNLS